MVVVGGHVVNAKLNVIMWVVDKPVCARNINGLFRHWQHLHLRGVHCINRAWNTFDTPCYSFDKPCLASLALACLLQEWT